MSVPHPSTSSLGVADGDHEEQQPAGAATRQSTPENGYEWKKYGQKYIQSIGKIRSYFKCRYKNCRAKKRMEWPPTDPSNLEIVYDGSHNHQLPSEIERAPNLAANQYELGNQVFGQPNDDHHR